MLGEGPRSAQPLALVPRESPQGQVGARVLLRSLHKASILNPSPLPVQFLLPREPSLCQVLFIEDLPILIIIL